MLEVDVLFILNIQIRLMSLGKRFFRYALHAPVDIHEFGHLPPIRCAKRDCTSV